MPWDIKRDQRCAASKPFGVVKRSDKKLAGCHSDHSAAERQLAALNAAERKDMSEETEAKDGQATTEGAETKDHITTVGGEQIMTVDMGPISFSEMRAEQQAQEAAFEVGDMARQFPQMVQRIFNRPDVEDKDAALETLATEFVEMSQQVLSENKERWQPLTDAVVGIIKKLKGDDPDGDTRDEEKESTNNFLIWKEGDRYRWFAIFSNNYRDDDNPPEILAAEAHEDFVKAVDDREWPYPELRHWHVPGSRWGAADWLAFDGNFAMASGLIDKGHEAEAEAVAAMDDVRVSHGMPRKEIERSGEDPTVITRYRSIEISDLPSSAAANSLTGFSILDSKEVTMLPNDKRQYLQDAGLSDEQIKQFEADLEGKKEAAIAAGLEEKDQASPEEQEATPATEPVSDDTPVTRSEVEALAKVVGEGLQTLASQVGELAGQVKELKEKGDEGTSLSDIFQSAVGHDQARQDGRQTLAKSRPKEAAAPDATDGTVLASGNTLANSIINSIVTGEAWEGFPGADQQEAQ